MRARLFGVGILLVAMALLSGVRNGDAEGTACRPEGTLRICRAEGFGTILNQDVAQARDEALIDARRRAVEQVAGVRVDAETITHNQLLFDQWIRTEARALIQADRILDEGTTGDGRYRVRVKAWVKTGDVTERLRSLISELSLVVLLPARNMGRPQVPSMVEAEMVSRLVDAGYRVLDHAQVQRVAARDQMSALIRGDDRTAREIGLRFLANILITGRATTRFSQNTQGMILAYARVTARAIEAETGRIIANVSLEERGFAGDESGAGERALQAAGLRAAERVLMALDGYFKRKERRLEVRVRGLPSLDEYRRAKAFLEKQRWMSGVAEGGFGPESLLFVTYPEKTIYLASRLAREPRYHLLELDWNRILVEYRGR